jgi:thiamine kinase-like enzyme
MYGRKSSPTLSKSDKNPNRVTGGLRAQGVDRFTMLGEDGSQQEVPSLEYVRSLEEQSKKQRAAIDVLERKLSRQQKSLEALENYVRNKNG